METVNALVAWWGALVATILAAFQFWKYRVERDEKRRQEAKGKPAAAVSVGLTQDQSGTWISATVTNTGEVPIHTMEVWCEVSPVPPVMGDRQSSASELSDRGVFTSIQLGAFPASDPLQPGEENRYRLDRRGVEAAARAIDPKSRVRFVVKSGRQTLTQTLPTEEDHLRGLILERRDTYAGLVSPDELRSQPAPSRQPIRTSERAGYRACQGLEG